MNIDNKSNRPRSMSTVQSENDTHELEQMLNIYSFKLDLNSLWDLPDDILAYIDPMFNKSPLSSYLKQQVQTLTRKLLNMERLVDAEINHSQEIDYFSPTVDHNVSTAQPTLNHNQDHKNSYQEYDKMVDSNNTVWADFLSTRNHSISPSNFDLISQDSNLSYGSGTDARINSNSIERYQSPLLIGPRPARVAYGGILQQSSVEYDASAFYPQASTDHLGHISSSTRQNPIPYSNPYSNPPSALPATHCDVRHQAQLIPTTTAGMMEANEALLHTRYPKKQFFYGNANPNLYYSSGAISPKKGSSWSNASFTYVQSGSVYRNDNYWQNFSSHQTFSHQNYYSQRQEPTQPLFRNRVYDTTRQYKKPEEKDLKTAKLVFDKSKIDT